MVALLQVFAFVELAFAPGHGEVEIYASGTNTYIEVENQGAYESIPPNGSVTWTVRWYLRYLPSNITPTAGSTELLDFVRGEIL